jgi:hypothetical protein
MLKQCLQLKNNYNTQNSINLAKDVTKLTIDENYSMITYIKDLYVNILIAETLKITEIQHLKNNDATKTKQIINTLRTIMTQSYFSFQNTNTTKKSLDMGYQYQVKWQKYSYNIWKTNT